MTQSYRGGSFDPNESRLNWQQSISENAKWQDRAAQQANEIIKMNAKTRIAEAGKGWDTLAELSPTVGKWIEKKHTEHLANEEAKGAEWYYLNGFPQDQAEAYDLAEQKENEASYDLNELTADMEAKGENIFVTDRYRKLSNAAKLGAIKAYTQSKASTYSPETIPQIVNAVDPTERNAALTAYRMEFFKQFQGINPAILNKHLYPTLRANESNAYKSWYSKRAKEMQEADLQRAGVELGTALFTESDEKNAKVKAIMHFVNSTHTVYGSKRLARNAAMVYLKTLAEQGKITDDFLNEIKAGEFVAHDGSKQKFGKYYENEIFEIEEAQKTFKFNQLKDIQNRRKLQEQAVFGAIDKQIHERRLSGTLTQTFVNRLPNNYPASKIEALKKDIESQDATAEYYNGRIKAIENMVSIRAGGISKDIKDPDSVTELQALLTEEFKQRVLDLELTEKDSNGQPISRAQAIKMAYKQSEEWFDSVKNKPEFLKARGYDLDVLKNDKGETIVLPDSPELKYKITQLKHRYNILGKDSIFSKPDPKTGKNAHFDIEEMKVVRSNILNAPNSKEKYTENAMIRFLADQNPDLTYLDVLKIQLDNFGMPLKEDEMPPSLKLVESLNRDIIHKIDNAKTHYQSARAWGELEESEFKFTDAAKGFLPDIVPDGFGAQCLAAARELYADLSEEEINHQAAEIAAAMELIRKKPWATYEMNKDWLYEEDMDSFWLGVYKYSGGSNHNAISNLKREGI